MSDLTHETHSFDNFATNLIKGLIAYNLLPKQPAMNMEIVDRSRLVASQVKHLFKVMQTNIKKKVSAYK